VTAGPRSALHSFAEQALGPCHLVTPLAGGEGKQVARIRDDRGHDYFAKRHTSAEKHQREVHAYQRWAPVLGSGAARLIATDTVTMTILVTALPGNPVQDQGSHAVQRQAGTLLRLLHNAEPPRPMSSFHDWLASRIHRWREQAASLLTTWEARLIDDHLAALHALGSPLGGPCHLDYQPRNWLLDQTGTLRVIDFEHARVGLQARDFVRLHFRCWTSRPDLRAAFFSGYGRRLTEEEDQLVRHCGAIDALTALVRGTQTGNPTMTAHGRATLRQLRGSD
jgi:phosphotransferase family enzyme